MTPTEKVNILMVDDRPENLISLAAVLDSLDYNLVKAESGREALRCLLDQDFALILLDVQMPLLDGFETAALIKKRDRSKNIPIIFITAISKDEPFMFRGYGAGAVDYITKPFDPDILRSKVAVFADLHRKNRALLQQADQLRQKERVEREKERVRHELELLRREQAANRRYFDLVDGIQHGIVWASDRATRQVTFVSPSAERLTGFSPREWMAEPGFIRKQLHHEDVDRVMVDIESLQPGQMGVNIEHRFVKADGSVAWFQTGVRLVADDDAGILELRGLSVDVTSLKRAEEAAHAAIRVRDEFLSIASHELKTPLTPLKLQLQALRRLRKQADGPSELLDRVSKALETSDRQVDRLSRLVDELLDVARITNGKLLIEREPVDLGELIRDVSARYAQELARAGCEIRLKLDDAVVGHWDRLRIEQVFTNLLTNAIKYAAGFPIEVLLTSEGGVARLSVRDHGAGIPSEARDRIFRRFERAVPASAYGGLGLGLYIVSEILEAHQGHIRFEDAERGGALFVAELPLESPELHEPSTVGESLLERVPPGTRPATHPKASLS